MKNKVLEWFNEIFNDKSFYKKLMIIAVPIVLQNLIGSSLNMVDTLMIGAVGENQLAAVGIANQFFLLILMGITGITGGTAIFTSQFWGKKDIVNIRRMLGICLISVVSITAVGTIFVLLFPHQIMRFFSPDAKIVNLGAQYLRVIAISYIFTAITFSYNFSLRSIGKTALPMIVSIVAVLINIICNYAFIFGHFGAPSLGVVGAALGTTIARVMETSILVGTIYVKKGVLAAKFKELIDIPKEMISRVTGPVVFVVLNELCWGLGMVVYTAAYGHISAGATASVQISSVVANLSTVLVFGLAGAASTMVGNQIGEGKETLGKLYAKRIAVIAVLFSIVLSSILALSSSAIVGLFAVSSQVASASLTILYITSGILVLRTFNVVVIVGILRGGGDAKMALYIEIITMWFVGVPMALLGAFILKWPVEIVFAMVALEEVVKFILCMYRFKSGKWAHNIIS
ncbi:MAG TPA: MATE family efflux transporter [Epulopiscium sp.]|nr:MATE family efflux transporter [Candidatus Epulonipiscium sp.]